VLFVVTASKAWVGVSIGVSRNGNVSYPSKSATGTSSHHSLGSLDIWAAIQERIIGIRSVQRGP